MPRRSISATFPQCLHHDGCISPRLRRTLGPSVCGRSLTALSSASTHQCPGTIHNLPCSTLLPSGCERFSGLHLHRQLDCPQLHKLSGRDSLSHALSPSTTIMGMVSDSRHLPICNTCSRPPEHQGGLSQLWSNTTPRLGDQLDIPTSSLPEMESSGFGSVHFMQQQEVPTVLLQRGSRSLIPRRQSPPSLEGQTCVYVSPNPSDTSGGTQTDQRETGGNPSHLVVALAGLVSCTISPHQECVSPLSASPRPPLGPTRSAAPSRCPASEVTCFLEPLSREGSNCVT